ncbi:glycosyltransferase family 25 protein [Thalassovita mediterranea]|jgi:glycosyl transferase family 25|uniref:Glycosyltransferase family 25 (LPS biosynthesis protein) n=2 Tax=Thalassovita mediterranea TaxID=340021 RepID=A0A0P1GRN0_9RHOB|nr:glycosyltransferase family 25 protein [Thalassovita mediterranea]CUH85150.1 Glycosyltransferase family 25 (LPS biosynthesis protein) [Thalassovita mediterranea]SIS30876.1 glycosyl transferase, family 25 [Thalassovita mediterranea]
MSIATFVVNLDADTERLGETRRQLQAAGVEFTRIAAVNGKQVEKTCAQPALEQAGRQLTCGEVGCFLSHRLAAQAFLDSDAEIGLVLEDDLAVQPHAKATLDALARDWRRQSIWDIANLARPAKHRFTQLPASQWTGPKPIFRAHYMPVTTAAIAWTRGGATEFLLRTQTFGLPVDVFIQRWVAETNRGLAMLEPPFASRDDDSTIGYDGRRRQPPFSRASRQRFKRLLRNHAAAARNEKETRKRAK